MQRGLMNGSINREDRDGDIWFGTEGGVCGYDGKAFNCFKS